MSTRAEIVLIGNFLPDRQQSMLRFERVLAEGFGAQDRRVEVLRPEPFLVRTLRQYRYGGLPKYLGYFDKYIRFPRILRKRARSAKPGTVFHIVDHSNAVYARYLSSQPLVVTCHDLLQIRSALGEFPQNRISSSGQKFQRWILNSFHELKCVACVSQKTREDLLRLARVRPEAAHVIVNGLNFDFRPVAEKEAIGLLDQALRRQNLAWPGKGTARTRFLFSIGGAQWYKNRTGLVRIFADLKARFAPTHAFVYVGPPFDSEQDQIIRETGLSESLLHVPQLSNEELRAAYALADGLIFPSWEEGFGWPIAEAQACGCPVFTSNRAPMTEVGGDAARYFDPADPQAAAAIIAEGLALPEPLRAAGLAYARRWDTPTMLDAYLKLYDTCSRTAPRA